MFFLKNPRHGAVMKFKLFVPRATYSNILTFTYYQVLEKRKQKGFVAFCTFFPCSLTIVHNRRQWNSSRAGQQNIFFKFQLHFNVDLSPKNAIKHPVAQWHVHAKHSGLNSIFWCLKMNQLWKFFSVFSWTILNITASPKSVKLNIP